MHTGKPPVFFESIPVHTPRQAIYTRLGYRRASTRMSAQQESMIEGYLDDALALIELKGTVLSLPITGGDQGLILLEGGLRFESASLARLLTGCSGVLLMGATAGKAVMEAIRRDTTSGDLTRGVVLDATASEVVDAALDWIMAYEQGRLLRERRCLTERRYSAGYGDFGLEYQRVFHDLLGLASLGVELTATNMLVPEKSVTAIAGIQEVG